MGTRGRSGMDGRTVGRKENNFPNFTHFKLAPVARAFAFTLAAGGMIGSAHAVQPFSPAWFANKGAIQATAAATGLMPNGTPVSSLSPQGQQQAANTQLQQSIANLTQAARGIAWLQGVQASQRQTALGNPSNIPDGLGAGGLDTGSLASSWVNASAPTQSTDANGKTVVDIQQTADKAIANWQTFNVGKNTIVQFDQASADWAILNRITDPAMAPSQIQGQIRAPGTVLIVNQNGIVFSGTSQINTRNLVAAAASITDQQFTQNGIYGPDQTTPSFTNASGNLVVEEGAQIGTSAPTSATQGGGYVLLMGQQVSNAGDIETPQGQIEMAAGDNFIIRQGVGTDANQSSTTRGNEISPQFNVGSTAGQVINTLTGLLLSTEGDITLAGHDVQQNGVAVATTTVNTRGTIHLLNSASDTTGSVTLGDASVTAVEIEDDGSTALDSQRSALIAASATEDAARPSAASGVFDNLSKQTDLEDESRIEIVSGGSVNFEGGSLTLATGGQIAVSATQRAFVADGAILDVAGQVDVNLAMSSNDVVVNVQGNELRDSPGNRDSGDLFNTNITVDRRDLVEVPASAADPTDRWYTANGLLEVSGYLNDQGHTIGEWAAQGGTIQLGGNEVVTQTGSQINLSGGSLNVATGYVAQTWLVGSDGQLYNANNAPAGMTFSGIYKGFEVAHTRWGANAAEFFYNPLIAPRQVLENGYTAGRDAGQLIVDAPTAVLEGDIIATVYNGPQQIRDRDAVDGYDQAQTAAAKAGTLSFGQYGAGGLLGLGSTDIQIGNIADITNGMAADAALSSDRNDTLWLDAGRLNAEGLGEIDLATSGSIRIAAPLTLANGGALNMLAPVIDIAADITAASGSVTATSIFQNAPLSTPDGVNMTLEGGATIDLRGLWINGLTDPDSLSGLAWLNGGDVSFDSTEDLTLAAGSAIDVSSGGAILANGKTQGGKGGNVTLTAGDATGAANAAGVLTLDGDIRAAGVNGGGTLTLSSPGNILIGADASLSGGTLDAGTTASVTLLLADPLTIPAGQPLPMTLTQNFTTIVYDVPVPVDIPLGNAPTGALLAPWVVPNGLVIWDTTFQNDVIGDGSTVILPAGFVIGGYSSNPKIPAGTVIPSGIFPNGLPVLPYRVVHQAGSVFSAPITYAAGSQIPAGTVLAETVAVLPAPALNPSFFNAGFANYDINGGSGILIADGTVVAPTMPVYQFNSNSFGAAAGGDPSAAMSLVLPPLFVEDAQNGAVVQRGGASLTLRSSTKTLGVASGDAIVVGADASITVDPGQSITLDAFHQVTVDGSLIAHGGSISLIDEADGSSEPSRNFDQSGNGRGFSIWVGDDALLDVSGAVYGGTDAQGRQYGIAENGGAIDLSGGTTFVIIRPGAQLNADGASVVINPTGEAGGALTLPSNGGSISLSSMSGIYMDGNLYAAAGGAGAAGGSLTVTLNTPQYAALDQVTVPADALVPGVMTVVQSTTGSSLPDDIAPGTDMSSLAFGTATVSVDAVKAGGFGSLSLNSDDYMLFAGNVSLSLSQSLMLTAGAFISGPVVSARPAPTSAPATGDVSLSAPYLLLRGSQDVISDGMINASIRHPLASGSPTTAVFEATADQIDIQGAVGFSAAATGGKFAPGYQTVSLTSQGDIRFLTDTNVATTSLSSDGDIDLMAAQIYPATGVVASVTAGQNNANNASNPATLTIGRVDGNASDSDPAIPLSVFGKLALNAPVIKQDGVVRAPLGTITIGTSTTQTIDLLPGSVTSVSAAGLTIPYGGTVDGVTYNYNGTVVKPGLFDLDIFGQLAAGIAFDAQSVDVQAGAVLDLSGGGNLTGAGFVSGRGGSVNILDTPLINANPATPLSAAGDKVYAIVPGYASGYAPMAPDNGAGDPVIGQQVTIPAGVPGLPAGVYTLLPSTYALLPGAYRVEIGKTVTATANSATAIGNGTYATTGNVGIANTDIRNALASTLLVTPGSAVRDYSQFDEEGYSDFVRANAGLFGSALPILPENGKTLRLSFEATATPSGTPAFTFDGTDLLQAAAGGFAGQVVVTSTSDVEVYADAPTAGFLGVSLNARDLTALQAPRLLIGGYDYVAQPESVLTFSGSNNVFIRDDVALKAGELFLIGNNIDVGSDVSLSTIGQGPAPFDSSDGYSYSARANSVLALSNGDLNFIGSTGGSGSIVIGAGASLYSEGTLAFATNGQSSIDPTAHFGSRDITLAVGSINIGSDADIAAAGGPGGVLFDQSLFDVLLHGDPDHGAPALEKITLAAAGAINLFGNASLDATGSGVDLVLNTPAIYGYGAAGDEATIAAGNITWNGVAGAAPPPIMPGGAGTGLGTLTLKADEIDLGQFVSLDSTSTSRVAYGFDNVNLVAGDRIVAAGNTALYVYQAPSTTAGDVFGQSGTGGNLTLSTPLLTGAQMSIANYTAGGVLTVNSPAGVAPSTATSTVSGAEIDLNADSVAIDSTILLPSGKLAVNANNDITLGADSRIDLSGQPSMIQSATVYGFGGTAIFNSVQGGMAQAAGSVIDVSATNADAGSITIGAGNGAVSLDGALKGTADAGYVSGDFAVTGNTIADFAGLNAILTQGGMFDARSFDLKSGDLAIGDGVKAHSVTVSVDDGSLTVNGTIDASGAAPGTIRLSAMNALTLVSTATLDAHGTQLQTDSYGQAIEAENRGEIELAATHGMLTLAGGSTMDVSAPDGIARGDIELNASRTAETSGDINIDASGAVNINGAQSIAVNAFWTYSPTDQYGTIVQDNGDGAGGATVSATGVLGMNQVDAQSQLFINAALADTGLQNRLAGLKAYIDAFHLRPGVEIDSATPFGTLTVSGDIDLAGFRYDSLNPNNQKTGIYGSGEPGALVIRAGGDLDIVGSISDGFMPAPATPDDNGWLLQAGTQKSSVETLSPLTLASGTTIPNTAGLTLRYDIPINAATIVANALIPTQVTLASAYTIPAGTRLTAAIVDSSGNPLYAAGTVLTTATTLAAGSRLGAGSVLPGSVNITAMNWQAGNTLGIFAGAVTLSGNALVPFEGIIPVGTNVKMATATAPTRPTDSAGTQGSVVAIGALLPEGSLSWSIRAVAGADLDAADTRIVKPASLLKAAGVSGNLTLTDSHFSITPAFSEPEKEYPYFFYGYGPYYTKSPTDYGCTHYGNTACGSAVYISTPHPAAIGGADPSVVRTGTGNLDLIAGGSFNEKTLFGVYTAGTQSAPALAPNGSNPYNQPLGLAQDGTLFGAASAIADADKATAAEASYQAAYPEHGGDVLVSAQNDVTGNIATSDNTSRWLDSDQTGNWLWRQGGGGLAADPTAWWINFGTFAHTNPSGSDVTFVGFQGIGTLGGGNLTVVAGRDAGLVNGSGSSGLDLAVASTGRVLADGTLLQTGGGDLTLKVGGSLNAVDPGSVTNQSADYFGSISDLRGDIAVNAGAVGVLTQDLISAAFTSLDPRTPDADVFKRSLKTAGPTVVPGDGTVSITTRGDLVLGGAGDAGMSAPADLSGIPYALINPDGSITPEAGGGISAFTLWTPTTAIALYSAGGDVAPLAASNTGNNTSAQNANGFYPGTLTVAAANGDIRFAEPASMARALPVLELMPSPDGQLALLAAGSIYGSTQVVAMSGADMSNLATPFQPLFTATIVSGGVTSGITNASADSAEVTRGALNPIAFGPDTPTGSLHAGDSQPALVYAGVDIDDLILGQVQTQQPRLPNFNPSPLIWYMAAKSFDVIAGRDIVGAGTTPDVFYNDNPTDITSFHAGRDILYQSITIAGPGVLDVQAGRNLYQGFYGELDSVGLLFDIDASNRAGGADIAVAAGVGPNGPDYADFAKLYFDAANQLPTGTALAGSGKVVHAYDQELLAWLQQRFGYTGTSADALAYFLALPAEQEGVFVRQIYYAELTAGGREFNDTASVRFQSYLRGRDAIAALFPTTDAQGNAIAYDGGITMFSTVTGTKTVDGKQVPVTTDAGIHTDFGGAIQILNPAGQTILGVEGVAPGAGAGLITQGEGDIDIYSEGSILLGESRIMTTFGGDILAWSATGDINAGRGSKTTVLFTPPRLVYDDLGDVTLSPDVPSTGAGIATLDPIPEVAAGDVDLIAPLGTIDAGEAGIRVSGNVNLAALQVVNAANIAVQGKSTGIPMIAAVNVGALTNASAAASQAVMAAQDVVQRDRTAARQALPSIFTVRVLGFGDDPADGEKPASSASPAGLQSSADSDRYDASNPVQILGLGGNVDPGMAARLSADERRALQQDR
jgi:filamentous hemagglutinin family protein